MSPRYSAVAILLHWAIALMIITMFVLGQTMKTADGQPIEWMYQLHKSVGISILVLTIARIIWRVLNPAPTLPEDMRPLEKTASKVAHVGFYALLLLLPLSGWALVSASPFAVSTVLYGVIPWPHLPGLSDLAIETRREWFPAIVETHHILSKTMFVLLLLHIAGALKHQFSAEEGVVKRMLPGLLGKTAAPIAPARGLLPAFGAAAAFFALVVGGPIAAQALNGSGDTQSEALANENWTVDADASSIRFSGTYEGDAFSGTFENWTASIVYDPDNPAAVQASVDVKTGSASTGKSLYDSTIEGAEWFNVSAFPVATVTVDGATPLGDDRYETDADMTIKGQSVPVKIMYSLREDGEAIIMEGSATLSRTNLDLGLSTDPNGTTVSDAISVDLTVRVTPAGVQ